MLIFQSTNKLSGNLNFALVRAGRQGLMAGAEGAAGRTGMADRNGATKNLA
jgi:hypothetical protein